MCLAGGTHIVVLMQQPVLPNRTEKNEDAKEIIVTIAYDEKSAGQRAAELFSSIGREQEGELQILVQPWRFDLLADPDWRRLAGSEASQADILVFAMSNLANFSAAVEQWFTTWLNGKRGFHAAVIALAGSEAEADSAQPPELQFLETATKAAGLDFFAPRCTYPDEAWLAPTAPPEAFSHGRPYRHWGLNE